MPNVANLLGGTTGFVNAAIPLIWLIALLTGLVFLGRAAWMMTKASEREERVTGGKVVGNIVVGAMMLQFVTSMDNTIALLFGESVDYRAAAAYATQAGIGSSFGKGMLEVCLLWVTFIGWLGAFKGFLLWKQAADGQGGGETSPFWRGLTHLVGGAACINIGGLLKSFFG